MESFCIASHLCQEKSCYFALAHVYIKIKVYYPLPLADQDSHFGFYIFMSLVQNPWN